MISKKYLTISRFIGGKSPVTSHTWIVIRHTFLFIPQKLYHIPHHSSLLNGELFIYDQNMGLSENPTISPLYHHQKFPDLLLKCHVDHIGEFSKWADNYISHHPAVMDDHDLVNLWLRGYPMMQETPISHDIQWWWFYPLIISLFTMFHSYLTVANWCRIYSIHCIRYHGIYPWIYHSITIISPLISPFPFYHHSLTMIFPWYSHSIPEASTVAPKSLAERETFP